MIFVSKNMRSYANCENLIRLFKEFKSRRNLYTRDVSESNSAKKRISKAGKPMSRKNMGLILKL